MSGHIKKLVIFYIKFLAALSLVGAGAIHTFPKLWMAWDEQIKKMPEIHNFIGAIALTLGIANLCLCIYEAIKAKGRRHKSQK